MSSGKPFYDHVMAADIHCGLSHCGGLGSSSGLTINAVMVRQLPAHSTTDNCNMFKKNRQGTSLCFCFLLFFFFFASFFIFCQSRERYKQSITLADLTQQKGPRKRGFIIKCLGRIHRELILEGCCNDRVG